MLLSGNSEKLEKGKGLGADAVVNYNNDPDWDEQVLQVTNGGAEKVIEIGGAGTFERSIRSTRIGGAISLVGGLAGNEQPLQLSGVYQRNLNVFGIYSGNRQMHSDASHFIAAHGIKPVVDCVFSFENTVEAYAYLQSAKHFGKVVIRLPKI